MPLHRLPRCAPNHRMNGPRVVPTRSSSAGSSTFGLSKISSPASRCGAGGTAVRSSVFEHAPTPPSSLRPESSHERTAGGPHPQQLRRVEHVWTFQDLLAGQPLRVRRTRGPSLPVRFMESLHLLMHAHWAVNHGP